MKRVCILGLGYIGLPTVALLTKYNYEVIGVDTNAEIIDNLKQGIGHIKEPGLQDLIDEAIHSRLFYPQIEVTHADIYIIAVPTPIQESNNGTKEPNIDYVINAIHAIAPHYKSEDLVILESTSPVGTTAKLVDILEQKTDFMKDKIHVAYCPERVIPGNTFYELINNNRVVGGNSVKASQMAQEFYKTFCKGEVHITNVTTAELVKLTENSYRDINIAFANEMSVICDHLDININELIGLANCHPRVDILNPGCGVGGHCIALDPWFIVSSFPELSPLIKTARNVNNNKTKWVIQQIKLKANKLEETLSVRPKIGCLGLAYKPNTDDLRESPALKIINDLIASGYEIYSCEPNIKSHSTLKIYSLKEITENCDLIVQLVQHEEFKRLSFQDKEFISYC